MYLVIYVEAAAMESEEMDALDAYMTAIKSGAMDTKTKLKLKRQLLELKQEEQKLRRLVNIAKPAALPDLKWVGVSCLWITYKNCYIIYNVKHYVTFCAISIVKIIWLCSCSQFCRSCSIIIFEKDGSLFVLFQ